MNKPEDNSLKSFTAFLQQAENGALAHDASEALAKVLEEIADANTSRGGKQKATLTLKLDFTIDNGLVDIRADIKTKTPAIPRGRSMFFLTPENNLSRQDPNQHTFDEVMERRNLTSN